MPRRVDAEPDFDATDAEFENELDDRFGGLKARGREMLGTAAERGRERLKDAAGRGKDRVAERLQGSAEYLRTSDVDIIGRDLISEVRRHPLRAVAIAAGAGYVIGRVLTPPTPSFGRSKKKSGFGDQIGRAIFNSVAAMAVARLQASLTAEHEIEEHLAEEHEEEPEPKPKPRTRSRPRKRAE